MNLPATPADFELVSQAQNGDREAFGLLYTRHKDWVYGYALHRVGEPEIATDLVQDIFIKAFQALPRFEPERNFGAWLNGITQHTVIDYLRRRYQRKEKFPMLVEIFGEADGYQAQEEIIYTREAVKQILTALSQDYRAVISLRLLEGRSTGETAVCLYGKDNQDTRRRVTVSLYKAMQAARQIAALKNRPASQGEI